MERLIGYNPRLQSRDFTNERQMIKLEDGEFVSVMFDKEDGLTVVCEKRVGMRTLSSGGMASCVAYRDEGDDLVDRICIAAMEELRARTKKV